jgi:hypothetical protein
MKVPSIAKFNALGFTNSCQRSLFAALQLFGGTNPSQSRILVPAVVANATAVPPITAKPAILSPAVAADPRFIGSTKITDMPTYILVEANLPYTVAAIAKGKSLSVSTIDQCSPFALDLGDWLGDPASGITGNEDFTGITTVEQLLYRESIAALAEIASLNISSLPASSVTPGYHQPSGTLPAIPVVKVKLYLPKNQATTYLGSVGAEPPFVGGE